MLRPGVDPDDAATVIASAVRGPTACTALLCGNHALLPQLLVAMVQADVAIPDECSLVTVGDSDWAAAFRPPISVIRRDVCGAAATMTEAVVAELRGLPPTPPPRFPSEFVRRASVDRARQPMG